MLRHRSIRRLSAVCVVTGMLGVGCNSVPADLNGAGATGQLNAANVLGQDAPPITPGEVAPFLPESIALDLSEIPQQVTAGTPNFSQMATDVQVVANLVRAAEPHINRSLTLAAAIRNDMIGPDQVHVVGSLNVDGAAVRYLADFSAFDIDGDEVADGSGSATIEPIALRIWVDRGDGYKRFACALVDVRPSDENVGAGRIIARPNAADPNAASTLRLEARWSRTDPVHAWNQVHMTGQLDQVALISMYHQRLDVRTYSDSSVEKHLSLLAGFQDRPAGLKSLVSNIHLRVGYPWVQTSANKYDCYLLPTIISVGNDPPTECIGFDRQDDDALRDLSDASFPDDFPLKPTF